MSATLARPEGTRPVLKEVLCPVCLARGKRRIINRATVGSTVEAFCRECRYRKIVTI